MYGPPLSCLLLTHADPSSVFAKGAPAAWKTKKGESRLNAEVSRVAEKQNFEHVEEKSG